MHFSPTAPVALVGHSMGGNVASLYAGIRPERVAKLANLEGFGLAATDPDEAPRRYRKWLDEIADEQSFRDYASFDELAARMQQNNPRLTRERALFLAEHWGQMVPNGRIALRSDPAHKRINPVLYRIEEARACWRRVTAPVLWVEGEQSETLARLRIDRATYEARKRDFPSFTEHVLSGAGHMLHHDQPEALAQVLEVFLRD